MSNKSLIQFTTIVTLALTTTMSAPAWAEKKVSNSTAADLQTQCLLAKDGRTKGSNNRFTICCSFSLGYCIECTMDKDEPCEKHEIREGRSRMFRDKAPNSGNIVAPNNNRPTVKARLSRMMAVMH
ncbi:hypothetical protein RXV86_09920 [Alisedimentitalea sp. MJ-SS2]|uniref:hypothetical protein n=1 Tax=Aliisedimentitalea sp. MJ-SS2 TaxID=3049795 RepID=UPI00290F5B61|nr:hypothetical protein [Alisedimentitalea sp. MJ-SS2]MDU8927699.1 hypothetical protein [Alisedimentitalea sp. MJ-SS2]